MSINIPYFDQLQSSFLGYHTKRISKEKLRSEIFTKILDKHYQSIYLACFVYNTSANIIEKKTIAVKKMKTSFPSQ